jgi:hypothetical protein
MTGLTDLQSAVLEKVREHTSFAPITGTDLANKIGLKPRDSGKEGADLRSVINALRVKGYPVCASGEGYWWPKDRVELRTYIDSFQGRIDDQLKACDGMRSALGTLDGPKPVETTSLWRVKKETGYVVIPVLDRHLYAFREEYPDAEKI